MNKTDGAKIFGQHCVLLRDESDVSCIKRPQTPSVSLLQGDDSSHKICFDNCPAFLVKYARIPIWSWSPIRRQGFNWVSVIRGGLSWTGIREFLQLWDCVQGFQLNGLEDRHIWKFEPGGCYSSKSAYRAYFQGPVTFEPWRRLWKSWAPNKCKVFLWLAIRNRCWTADRLEKRGLPHPEQCPLCDKADETVQHLLVSCVVARQVWFKLFAPLNLGDSIPRQRERSFAEWWRKVLKKVKKECKKGVNSLIILGAWTIWKHRNACVFEGIAPLVDSIMQDLKDEHNLWCLAGAKKLQGLGLTGVI